MDMVKLFHMNGGIGESSYSRNSELQKIGIIRTKGIIEEAVSELCDSNATFPETLVMADLGCSSGPNTLLLGSMLVNAVAKTSFKMGLKSPELQINLNDLPTNDFNTVFIALQELQRKLTNEKIMDVSHRPACFFTGVPGSFFGRLFPMKTLHFLHSSYGLQWLSQLPELEEINKGNVYLSSTTPHSVITAYFEQFQKDFLNFLTCRSEEMMAGGRMVLTLGGRTTDDPRDEEGDSLWGPLAMALQDMVFEGIVEEEKFNSFNIPQYTPSSTEIMNLVKMEGSFTIDHLEIFHLSWEDWKRKNYDNDATQVKETDDNSVGHVVAQAIRSSGIEPLVSNHFGEAITDDVFMRYEKILKDRKSNKEYETIVSITVSLTRKV